MFVQGSHTFAIFYVHAHMCYVKNGKYPSHITLMKKKPHQSFLLILCTWYLVSSYVVNKVHSLDSLHFPTTK